MEAGYLNDIIDIYKMSSSKNEYGEQTESYDLKTTVRAHVRQISSNRTDDNNEIFYGYVKEFIVRYHVAVDEFDQIQWNNHKYRILNINKDRTFQRIVIDAELINE